MSLKMMPLAMAVALLLPACDVDDSATILVADEEVAQTQQPILGGTLLDQNSPLAGSVLYMEARTPNICSAVCIGPKKVLLAAHCVKSPGSQSINAKRLSKNVSNLLDTSNPGEKPFKPVSGGRLTCSNWLKALGGGRLTWGKWLQGS